MPRSARSRKISFKDESERKVKEDSDEMSEEEEEVRVDQSEASIYPTDQSQEVLRLDTEARTFSQEIVSSSQAVMVCKAAPVKVRSSVCIIIELKVRTCYSCEG